eukprot:g1493.t1
MVFLTLNVVCTMALQIAAADTSALDTIDFYPSCGPLLATDSWGPAVVSVASLNDGLWAAANTTGAETPFSKPPHPPGIETVLNYSASPVCLNALTNLSDMAPGVATLPTSGDAGVQLGKVYDLSFEQCASHCCTAQNCSAFAWYDTVSQGRLCQPFTRGYSTGPQPYAPGAEIRAAVGGVLGAGHAPAAVDHIANGLRSGTFLGGVGTGGYELRADGTFHLSTLRNQSPAAEPWQGTVRDAVLAVSLDGTAHVVRLRPFGNISAVPQIVYQERFPIAKLSSFAGGGRLTLYAYSALSPGDNDGANTPAVIFTLHITADNAGTGASVGQSAAASGSFTNVTFMVVQPFAVRNDWRQVGRGMSAGSTLRQPNGTTSFDSAAACAAACHRSSSNNDVCYAWDWEANTGSCTADREAYAQGANVAGIDSGNPGNWTFEYAHSGDGDSDGHRAAQPMPTVRFTTEYNAVGGTQPYNGLGTQALFVPAVSQPAGTTAPGFQATRGVGAAGDVESLLSVLHSAEPAASLNRMRRPVSTADGGALFAGATVTVSNLPAPGSGSGGIVSLSIVHAWHFPHAYFYRDTLGGSDNGVRYATTYANVDSVGAALNLTQITQNLALWQDVYRGLSTVDPALSDAAFNMFNHVRSAMWTGPLPTSRNTSGTSHAAAGTKLAPQYRQWESLEFTDFSNPTNGDERHLIYFHTLPQTMRSKLLSEAAFAQNSDGMFQCVVNSMKDDHQWGNGDPCPDSVAGYRTPASHPDDISMFMVGVYELYALANDTALVDDLYERALLPAFGYYVRVYNASLWHVPFKAHETYDAVKESSSITGEGNQGASLYNALNYLCGLYCMRGFAAHRGDTATEASAAAMIALVQQSIQDHFWLPDAGYYAGDTGPDYSILMEEADPAVPYHSSDGLHGQVLAYRLGFGDLLPRAQMLSHQRHVSADLATPWGLSFDRYAQENWLMADHANSALFLRWHAPEGWNTSLAQARYWREVKKEATRHTAVLSTRTGEYKLLNYYGYALFFFHTISAWTGQTAHLPHRSLEFQPHASAFVSGSGVAMLPVMLGGDMLGTMTITPTRAVLRMAFLRAELSFLNVTVCQHVFAVGAGVVGARAEPYVVTREKPLVFDLATPCKHE